MQQLICVPITETKVEAFLKAIEEADKPADIIELRLDYLSEDDLIEFLAALPKREISKPLLFTFRPRFANRRGSERHFYWLAF